MAHTPMVGLSVVVPLPARHDELGMRQPAKGSKGFSNGRPLESLGAHGHTKRVAGPQ